MNHAFWTNTIWYVALAATSAAALIIIFLKTSESRKTFAFFFAVLGLTYCFEVALVLLFNAYTYYPMIYPDDPFFDAVLGNIFSQVSVSSSAVLLCVLGLSNWWLAGFSGAYYLIDVFFIRLGLYEHFWYRSVFSLVGFFIYGQAVRYWYNRIFSVHSKYLYCLTLFLSVFAVTTNLIGTLLKLLGLRVFQFTFYTDPSRNHTAMALIYGAVLIIFMIALDKRKLPWWQGIFFFLLLLGFQRGLIHSGVIVVRPGWEIVIMLFDLAMFYGWTVIMSRYLKDVRERPLPPG
jgi:hypothetical protein